MVKKPLVILAGPTAVGKTALSIGLAKAIGGEIISADSMQAYRGMDIGTDKIKPEQMQGIRHHLIDEFDPDEEFNVAIFKEYCGRYISDAHSRGKIPIIVGGSGFYIQAALYDVDFKETDADLSYRKELEDFAKKNGAKALHAKLMEVDEASAKNIHENNIKRTIRALEYFKLTGEPISRHNEMERKKSPPYDFRYFVLNLPREVLYERINARVDDMRRRGLEDEVRGLLERGASPDMTSMQGLGYKEIACAIRGGMTMDEAFEKIKRETRHFAKRQLTWFRREKDAIWIEKDKFSNDDEVLLYCLDKCRSLLHDFV